MTGQEKHFAQAVYFTEESRIGTIYDCRIEERGNFLAIWKNNEEHPDYYNTAVVSWISGIDRPHIDPFTGEPHF